MADRENPANPGQREGEQQAPGGDSLATTAGTQVQSIIEAAQITAASIEAHARASAERARSEATAQSQAHVAAVAEATATLLARVESMERELSELLESLRAGATRLREGLEAVEENMGALSGPGALSGTGVLSGAASGARPVAAPSVQEPAANSVGGNGDLDGARLIALNMALNGEPRAQADRYLAENFQLADRQKLIDEVYAAVEG